MKQQFQTENGYALFVAILGYSKFVVLTVGAGLTVSIF